MRVKFKSVSPRRPVVTQARVENFTLRGFPAFAPPRFVAKYTKLRQATKIKVSIGPAGRGAHKPLAANKNQGAFHDRKKTRKGRMGRLF